MSKAVEAEYIAEERVLKLARPLDGIRNHERVRVLVEAESIAQREEWPTLDKDAGRELAQAVRDAFGRDNIAV